MQTFHKWASRLLTRLSQLMIVTTFYGFIKNIMLLYLLKVLVKNFAELNTSIYNK